MDDITCRGSYALGTACQKCSKCEREKLSGAAFKYRDPRDARIAKLEAALSYYADIAQYEGISLGVAPLNNDRGAIARKALEE